MRMSPGRWPKMTGFTLIEVMISITLFAIVLGLLLGVIRFTSRAWDAGERVSRQSSDLELAQWVLRNLVAQAFPLTVTGPENRRYLFSGDHSRLRFTAFLPPYPGQGGLYLLELYVQPSETGYQLRLKRRLFDPRTPPEEQLEDAEDRLVTEAGFPFGFDYAATQRDDTPLSWKTRWSDHDPPPGLIRLSREDRKGWPEIVVHPSIDLDGSCLSPALGGLCRWKIK